MPTGSVSTMTYEDALKEARRWAEGAQITSTSAYIALGYIYGIPNAKKLANSEGERVQLLYILNNLQGWKGATARAAKEAIKTQVRKLGRKA